MLDVLIGLALTALGFYFGRATAPKEAVKPPQPEEQELVRLQEEKLAFSQLMGYNAERAYGKGE